MSRTSYCRKRNPPPPSDANAIVDASKHCPLYFRYELFIPETHVVAKAVKKTISLPTELAKEAEEIARAEGKSLSAVVQEALRTTRALRLKSELREIQGHWRR